MLLPELVRFHLTGEPPTDTEPAPPGLRPAVLASLQDLSTLRYDFPLLLTENGDSLTLSLSELFDDILREVAPPGPSGERIRRHLLGLELRIRRAVSGGEVGLLSQMWEAAAKGLLAETNADEAALVQASLAKAEAARLVDGRAVDCDDRLASDFLEHIWTAVGKRQRLVVRQEIAELTLRLSNILQADYSRSQAGLAPERLAGSVGVSHRREFDFEAWSRMVTGTPSGAVGPDRRRRLESILSILENQRFIPGGKATPYSFRFDRATAAATAFRQRVPEMLELIKAMTIARLEIENRYREPKHDEFFAAFDETSPTAQDLAAFPSYLVTMQAEDVVGTEQAQLVDILSSSLPIKVLVESDDILGESPIGDVRWSPGVGGGRLGNLAIGLGEAFTMQSASSNLPRMEETVVAGLSHQGPALFSVFGGSKKHVRDLPRYLTAASAMRSRAFPAFTYDPGAGDDWAARFRVDGNPAADDDWPVEALTYEDDNLQRITEEVRFTFVDFAACDSRYADHFVPVPRSSWNDQMEPAWRFLNGEAPPGKVPYILMATADNLLQRLVVDRELIEAARRCRRQWNSLQELGGIHNSHARRLLEQARARWEEETARELKEVTAGSAAAAVIVEERPVEELETPPAVEEAAVVELPEEAPPADEPYIETARCTTCDECTTLNSRMFAYDENKQAIIADLGAGSYRQMVEAAEACQVAIIHPGKPWNPSEPGLEELVERAAAFN